MQNSILAFNPEIGHYSFREKGLTAMMHRHPSLEIIRSVEGVFTLTMEGSKSERLMSAVILPNHSHALNSEESQCLIDMFDLELLIPEACAKTNREQLIQKLEEIKAKLPERKISILEESIGKYCKGDHRVGVVLAMLSDTTNDRVPSLQELSQKVYISESQLSRLFTRTLGLPLRRFLVYRRLRAAVTLRYLQDISLTEAAYAAGFTDLAHFSRQFTANFGVKPSLTYKVGRSIQVK